MGKKIALSVFAGIAVLGLGIMITGFAMGGRLGSINVSDGQWVYSGGAEDIPFGDAPRWANGLEINLWGFDRQDWISRGHTAGSMGGAGETLENSGRIKRLYVEIGAGYVVIKRGDSFNLTVDGPLRYDSYAENGGESWHIESRHENISDHLGRFWLFGRDITTTFTITVPHTLTALELSLGMGSAQISGIETENLNCRANLGGIEVSDVIAQDSSFSVDLGSTAVTGFAADNCELDCGLGSIELDGEVRRTFNADCSMGSVSAVLKRPEGYTLESDADMGSIQVDGEHITAGFSDSDSHTKGSPDGALELDLSCDMGSIEILFR